MHRDQKNKQFFRGDGLEVNFNVSLMRFVVFQGHVDNNGREESFGMIEILFYGAFRKAHVALFSNQVLRC